MQFLCACACLCVRVSVCEVAVSSCKPAKEAAIVGVCLATCFGNIPASHFLVSISTSASAPTSASAATSAWALASVLAATSASAVASASALAKTRFKPRLTM